MANRLLTRSFSKSIFAVLVAATGTLFAQDVSLQTDNLGRARTESTDTSVVDEGSLLRCDNVAHRGFSSIAPENTLAAIRAAVKSGATGCEFDVYRCGDGTVVLMHDDTVDRTTDGTGKVTELTLNQLRRLDAGSWKHLKYKGERIPTLTEALKLLAGSGCQPVIEIKMEGISRSVIEDVRALDMIGEVAVIAFSQNVVREVRQLEPGLTCAWLCGEVPEGTLTEQVDWLVARAHECQTNLLDLNYKMLSPELISELNRCDLSVWTWTVNEAAQMKKLRKWGVASITTDRPDLLSNQLRSVQRSPANH